MKVRNLLGKLELLDQEKPVPDFCLPKQAVGMEYEWEGCDKFHYEANGEEIEGANKIVIDVGTYFDWHIDGSLRGKGKEFTFKGPMFGSKILRATTAMDECSRAFGFTSSYRTSMHVHLDMQDVNFPEDIVLFGGVYCVVEPFLYQFVGQNRNTSNYCIPWYKHPQHFENFLDTIKYKHRDGSTGVVSHFLAHKGDKYAGLNAFALGQFGTVEFRQAPVNMQRDKIITWLNLLMRIKQWVVANPGTPSALLDKIARIGGPEFVRDVFKSHYTDAVRLSRNIEADVWSGLETLYQYLARG